MMILLMKIIWENNKDANAMEDGFPHLIYVSREKRPRHSHHFKAGAMNVLVSIIEKPYYYCIYIYI